MGLWSGLDSPVPRRPLSIAMGTCCRPGLPAQSGRSGRLSWSCSRSVRRPPAGSQTGGHASSCDVAEQPMLNLVSPARARRKVADADIQSRRVGQLLQSHSPQPRSRTVAPAAVGGDQQHFECGNQSRPISSHQRRIVRAANLAMSMPTLAHAWLFVRSYTKSCFSIFCVSWQIPLEYRIT